MADQKISQLTSLIGADAAEGDLIPIVDVSTSTTKKINRTEFFRNVPGIRVNTLNNLPGVDNTDTGVTVLNGELSASSVVTAINANRNNDGAAQRFRRAGVIVGGITVDATSTSYNTSSDYRLKEDVQPMVGACDRLLALNPVNFAWKANGSRVDGFLAHEAQAVVPEAVTGDKDGEEMQAIDQSKLVPLLTAALQDALKSIEDLEARITALGG